MNGIIEYITYDLSSSVVRVSEIIYSLWSILRACEDMRRVFEENPRIVYRRPKNLRNILVRSKIQEKVVGINVRQTTLQGRHQKFPRVRVEW